MTRVGVFASPDEAREFKQLLLQLRAAGYALNAGSKRPAVLDEPQEFVVYNSSGEAVPPFAVMQCLSQQDGVIEIDKPVDRYGVNGPYLINGGKEIAIDGRGIGRNVGPIIVHTDASAEAELDRLSAEVDQWYAIRNPAGNLTYLGTSDLRDTGDIVFAIVDGYPQVIHAKTGPSGIAVASGSTTRAMAKADCTLYESSSTGSLTDSELEIELYNFAATAVASDTFVMASRNDRGLWVVVAEDCT
jgi:hypothetical protein